MFEDLDIDPDFFGDTPLYHGQGCDRCKKTGYAGRVAILELMTVTDEIRKLVIDRASAMEIGRIAREQSMKTLRDVALGKVRDGLTTLEQVLVCTAAH
jgi:type II secretory ATPase GspE/PulE/Tfp pilus assembly ATPase PilB-like protein